MRISLPLISCYTPVLIIRMYSFVVDLLLLHRNSNFLLRYAVAASSAMNALRLQNTEFAK